MTFSYLRFARLALIVAACVAFGFSNEMRAADLPGHSSQRTTGDDSSLTPMISWDDVQPAKAPLPPSNFNRSIETPKASMIEQTSCDVLQGAPCDSVGSACSDDCCDGGRSGLFGGRWCERAGGWKTHMSQKMRDLRRNKNLNSQYYHKRLLHPSVAPYCEPTWGYFPTTWRRFPPMCGPYLDEAIYPEEMPAELPGAGHSFPTPGEVSPVPPAQQPTPSNESSSVFP